MAPGGRGRGKGSGCRAASRELFLSCGQTSAQSFLIGPAYCEEEPELLESLMRITLEGDDNGVKEPESA